MQIQSKLNLWTAIDERRINKPFDLINRPRNTIHNAKCKLSVCAVVPRDSVYFCNYCR